MSGASSRWNHVGRWPTHLLTSRFAVAGALGCAITHGALTPVDVVKTRIQLSPEVYNKVCPARRGFGRTRALTNRVERE